MPKTYEPQFVITLTKCPQCNSSKFRWDVHFHLIFVCCECGHEIGTIGPDTSKATLVRGFDKREAGESF